MKDTHASADVIKQAQLITSALSRIDAKRELRQLAKEVVAGNAPAGGGELNSGAMWLMTEDNIVLGCTGGTSENFQCATGKTGLEFDCKTQFPNITFSCKTGYSQCGGQTTTFNCADLYDCNAEFYECWIFSCGKAGEDRGDFECVSKFDFSCGGYVFVCEDFFECDSGHVFVCTNNNQCPTSFYCKTTNPQACDKDHPYSRPQPPATGGDTSPGDFICGKVGGEDDYFSCKDVFHCDAKDQFDCDGGTKFVCTDNEEFDQFSCGATTTFNCADNNKEWFTCPVAHYECKGTFAPDSPPPP